MKTNLYKTDVMGQRVVKAILDRENSGPGSHTPEAGKEQLQQMKSREQKNKRKSMIKYIFH